MIVKQDISNNALKHAYKIIRSHHYELKNSLEKSQSHKHQFEMEKSELLINLDYLAEIAKILDERMSVTDYSRTLAQMRDELNF